MSFKKIHSVSSRKLIASDMKLDEAKEHVEKRYERAYKRLEDQKKTKCCRRSWIVATSLDPHSNYLRWWTKKTSTFNAIVLEGIGAHSATKRYTVIEQYIAACASSGNFKAKINIR